jgi:hypothetical protein
MLFTKTLESFYKILCLAATNGISDKFFEQNLTYTTKNREEIGKTIKKVKLVAKQNYSEWYSDCSLEVNKQLQFFFFTKIKLKMLYSLSLKSFVGFVSWVSLLLQTKFLTRPLLRMLYLLSYLKTLLSFL